jgi:hypothetical protein
VRPQRPARGPRVGLGVSCRSHTGRCWRCVVVCLMGRRWGRYG